LKDGGMAGKEKTIKRISFQFLEIFMIEKKIIIFA
jgi:hypothetical protein